VAFGTPNPHHVYATGVALPGDSGSPVISSDGLAVGVLVSTGTPPWPAWWWPRRDGSNIPPDGVYLGALGTIAITRLGPQLAAASKRLGLPLSLVTGPPMD
jgi:hypothetical protein